MARSIGCSMSKEQQHISSEHVTESKETQAFSTDIKNGEAYDTEYKSGDWMQMPDVCRDDADISNIEAHFAHPADMADHIENLSLEKQVCVLQNLSKEDAAEALAELEESVAVDVLENLDPDTAAQIIAEMSPDDAADVLDELDEDIVTPCLINWKKKIPKKSVVFLPLTLILPVGL